MVVSRDVWESGVHALTNEEIAGIYEGRITNWREVGGSDRGGQEHASSCHQSVTRFAARLSC